MNEPKYAIGIDYGTESGRAVLVDISTGLEVATHVTPYANGVIEETLPGSQKRLEPHFALQDPEDYLDVLKQSVPEVIRLAGIHPNQVIGIGVDFTSCTVVPVNAALSPLCQDPNWRDHPHAWVKLWKHHAAQEEADKMTQIASARNEDWLKRYGGKISSEWLIPKIWQVLEEAPDVFDATDLYLEAGDWIVAQMTGAVKRNSCAAGYKGTWHKGSGNVSDEFLEALNPKLKGIYQTKLRGEVVSLGSKVGELSEEFAQWMNLNPGTAVAIGIIDAHAGVPGVGVATPGKMVMVMGTSTCHMLLSENEVYVEGISGVVEDGIIPGLFAYEAGQAAVGDIFAWFVKNNVPFYLKEEAEKLGIGIHGLLEKKASHLKPGESGLLALDWHNGNRTPLVDTNLSGLILGQTLATKPEEMYRALIEATAFGTRLIIDTFKDQGIEINELYACGGLPHRNKLLMQIYADVTNIEIKVSATTLTPSVGAAMYGAVAAGLERGGYDSVVDAANKMARLKEETFIPIPVNVKIYEDLYKEYKTLYEFFGRETNSVMKRIKGLQDVVRKQIHQFT